MLTRTLTRKRRENQLWNVGWNITPLETDVTLLCRWGSIHHCVCSTEETWLHYLQKFLRIRFRINRKSSRNVSFREHCHSSRPSSHEFKRHLLEIIFFRITKKYWRNISSLLVVFNCCEQNNRISTVTIITRPKRVNWGL